MKDMIKCMVLTSALLNTCVVLASCTETTNVVKWTYEISNGGVVLGGDGKTAVPKDTSGGLVIPEKIDGKPVRGIRNSAFEGCRGLTEVTIPEGVTNIGEGAFYGCSGLTSMTIPSSVTNLGADAFFGCSGLTSVVIPSSVTKIGSGEFYGCRRLTTVTIPSSVTSIGNYAFEGCSGLKSMTIPSSVTNIGYGAFRACSKLADEDGFVIISGVLCDFLGKGTSVTIPSSVTNICDGAFFNCRFITSLTIPSSVTNIGCQAFCGCESLRSITMPSSVTGIAVRTFEGCKGLTSVTIPLGVTSIGKDAFRGCSGLMSVTIPEGVTSIGSGAFEDCSSLASVCIPQGVTNIAFAAFRGCKKLKSVSIPNSVTSIGMYAFSGCGRLESVTIPSSTTSIGECVFDSGLKELKISSLKGCIFSRDGALKSLTIPRGVTSIGVEAFRGFYWIETVTIPTGVENIGALAFYDCGGLKSVTIPASVTNIGHEAFAACSRLESVTIPSSVTRLAENAFLQCPKLTTVCVVRDGREEQLTIDEFKERWKSRMVDRTSIESRRQAIAHGKEKNVRIWKDPQTEITWCYFVCKDNTASLEPSLCFSKGMPTLSGDVVIPEILDGHVVTDIVWWDIGDCVDLTSLRIPKTVRQLRMNSASVFTLTNLTIDAGCRCSRSIGRFVLEGTWLQAVCAGGTKRLVIPEEVEGLVEGCFAGASWLEEVRIPSTVKKVAASSFAGCKGLYRRYDPDGRGYMVFDGWLIPDGNIKCRELGVPMGVRHIASTEYPDGCWKNVTSVKFPEGLVSIGEGAFVGSNIETIEFPASLMRCDGFGKSKVVFGRRVVSDKPLQNVIFNSGNVSFGIPDSVRRVTFAEGVTDIGVVPEGWSRSGLSGGAGVTTIVLPSGLRSIHALPDFPELTEITIPSSVTNIGKTVFQSCKNLKSVGVEKNGSVELVPIDEFRKRWDLMELMNPAVRPARGNLLQSGLLRARRLQRQQEAAAAEREAAREAERRARAEQEKAQREAEWAEDRKHLLAIQEELKRVREAKAAEKQKGK